MERAVREAITGVRREVMSRSVEARWERCSGRVKGVWMSIGCSWGLGGGGFMVAVGCWCAGVGE